MTASVCLYHMCFCFSLIAPLSSITWKESFVPRLVGLRNITASLDCTSLRGVFALLLLYFYVNFQDWLHFPPACSPQSFLFLLRRDIWNVDLGHSHSVCPVVWSRVKNLVLSLFIAKCSSSIPVKLRDVCSLVWTACIRSFHGISVGLKSRLWLVHSKTLRFFCFNHPLLEQLVCLWSLSCCIIHFQLSCSSQMILRYFPVIFACATQNSWLHQPF